MRFFRSGGVGGVLARSHMNVYALVAVRIAALPERKNHYFGMHYPLDPGGVGGVLARSHMNVYALVAPRIAA